MAEVHHRGRHTAMDDGDYAGNQGLRALKQIKSDFNSLPCPFFDPLGLVNQKQPERN